MASVFTPDQSVCVKLEPLNSHFSRWWDPSPVTTALSECRDVQQMLQKPDLKSAWSDQGSKRMFTQGTEIRSADSTIMDFCRVTGHLELKLKPTSYI